MITILIDSGNEQINYFEKLNLIQDDKNPKKETIEEIYQHYKNYKALDTLFTMWGKYWVDKGHGLVFCPILRHELNKNLHGREPVLAGELSNAKKNLKFYKHLKRIIGKNQKTASLPDLGTIA